MAKHAAAGGDVDKNASGDAGDDASPTPAADPSPTAEGDPEATAEGDPEAAEEGDLEAAEATEPEESTPRRPWSTVRLATVAGLAVVVALAGLTGWLAYQTQQQRQADQQRARFVEAGRQGVLNLTSVDWQQAEADVQRILDSSTGPFYDQFAKRATPYSEVVKQAKSTSIGTVQQAGLESVSDDGTSAKVLVAASIAASNAGAPEQPLRFWRMRVTVEQADGQMKVSDVEFVQ